MSNSVDDFLNYRGSGGGGGKRLKGWKQSGMVQLWLQMKVLPKPIWVHKLPKIVLFEDKQTRVQNKRVWMDTPVCREDEEFAKLWSSYMRGKEDEPPPPKKCPVCRVHKRVADLVESKQVQLLQPIFRFEADDPKETIVLHAGGFSGMIRRDDAAHLAAVKQARLRMRDVSGENAIVKLNYLFQVVSEKSPGDGVCVTIESEMLGDKVKKAIHDRRRSKGKVEGDPYTNPVCFEWEFVENSRNPQDMFAVRTIDQIALTPSVEKLIKGNPIGVGLFTKRLDPDLMRALLEKNCLVPKLFDWDALFEVEEVLEEEDEDTKFPPDDVDPDPGVDPVPESTPDVGRTPEVSTTEAKPDRLPGEDYVCEACGKPSGANECRHCGAKYDADGNLIKDPPKEKPLLRRGVKPAADPPPAASKPSPAKSAPSDEGDKLPWDD